MLLLDFIFYYLALYFTKRRGSLSWSNPEQRTSYALGLITTSWLMAILFFTLTYILKTTDFNSAYMLVLVPVALLLIWFYQYLYIDKGRYEFLRAKKKSLLKLSDYAGILIAWLILLVSFMLPFFILYANMK